MDTDLNRVIVTISGSSYGRLRSSPRFPRDPRGRGARREEAACSPCQQAGLRARFGPHGLAARERGPGDRRCSGLHGTQMTTETKTEAASLVRELGTIDAAMIVVGSMIGSGIFITSAESARYVGAPGWLLVAWGLAGLMTVSGSICAAEIAAMMPRAGGQYVFLREAYSPIFGFLFGWSMFLVVQTGTIAAVAVAFAKFLGVFLPKIAADKYAIEPVRARRLRRQPLVSTTRGRRR